VVLPLPGGPQKIREGRDFWLWRSLVMKPDLPVRWPWPKNWSNAVGLNWSARGVEGGVTN